MVEATCPVAEREPRIGTRQRVDLIINLKTANWPTMLAPADEVIE